MKTVRRALGHNAVHGPLSANSPRCGADSKTIDDCVNDKTVKSGNVAKASYLKCSNPRNNGAPISESEDKT